MSSSRERTVPAWYREGEDAWQKLNAGIVMMFGGVSSSYPHVYLYAEGKSWKVTLEESK